MRSPEVHTKLPPGPCIRFTMFDLLMIYLLSGSHNPSGDHITFAPSREIGARRVWGAPSPA
jgi:hypothetical protein